MAEKGETKILVIVTICIILISISISANVIFNNNCDFKFNGKEDTEYLDFIKKRFITRGLNNFEVTIGPIMDEDDNPVKGAKITITVNGTKYSNVTNEKGYALIYLPEPLPEGEEFNILVTKKGYEDLEFIALNDDVSPYPFRLKKEKKEESNGFIPGFETFFILIGFLIVMIHLKERKNIHN